MDSINWKTMWNIYRYWQLQDAQYWFLYLASESFGDVESSREYYRKWDYASSRSVEACRMMRTMVEIPMTAKSLDEEWESVISGIVREDLAND